MSPKEFQHIYYLSDWKSNSTSTYGRPRRGQLRALLPIIAACPTYGIADKNPNNPFDSTANQFRSRLRLLKAWMLALNRRYQGPLPTDTVPRIPKRCCRFDEMSNVREPFWGLYAREAVSFIRVTIYIFVSVVSSFAFCLCIDFQYDVLFLYIL
ncbi:uncharacterized protein CLUP02_00324 [Colletotrichum lupini]|uniref:Uncharacterized protein n=1 Tax=Colletotrichum lupini TaxID=145971 RepID=A0A9Q8SAI9_9PEZI|nr:uncharacterized protein CLUP02_00324 [Colletotrichum lupini]UQC73679.1 hypothetical protein CLUP02_00324 [Colletotrichum lupini]